MITAIILSAGKSSRMGQIKALLPFGGKTFIENIIENARNSGINEILVVLGFNKEKIEPLVKNAAIVVNLHPEEGQFSSLKTGLRHLPAETDAALVHLVDVPQVKSETFRTVIEAHRDNPEKIIISYYKGGHGLPCTVPKALAHGHPVIFPRKFFKDLLNYPADKNARDFIREQATDDILNLEVDDPGILKDFDTREDLAENR